MTQQGCVLTVILTCCSLWRYSAAHPFTPRAPYRLATVRASGLTEGPDLVSRCHEKWHNTTLDHYTWVSTDWREPPGAYTQLQALMPHKPHSQARHSAEEAEHVTRTYMQRYFVCDEYWKPDGPMFFYLGNEADVLLCAVWS